MLLCPETTSLIAEKVDSLQTSESESKVIQQGALETDLNGAEDSEIEQDGTNDDVQANRRSMCRMSFLILSFRLIQMMLA